MYHRLVNFEKWYMILKNFEDGGRKSYIEKLLLSLLNFYQNINDTEYIHNILLKNLNY